MNLGLTTSFIIAGILLLSILSMNMNLTQSSTQLTMQQITQQRANTISEILQYDIPNIGYKQNGAVSSPIQDADPQQLRFESDIDNDGTVESIEWTFTSTEVSSTKNPDDLILTRSVDGDVTEFKNGVIHFDLSYLDKNRNTTTDPDKIRHIIVDLSVESPEPIGGGNNTDTHYVKTTWSKQFTPMNLKL